MDRRTGSTSSRDAKPEEQEARAIEQQTNLVETLKAYDPRANYKIAFSCLFAGRRAIVTGVKGPFLKPRVWLVCFEDFTLNG